MTNYMSGDYVAVHENPALRDKANFIIRAYIGKDKDGNNEWEQLWALDLGDRKFMLCCIPFFVFDLALGDQVETDENYILKKVIIPSGKYTFRVWFGDENFPETKREFIHDMEKFSIAFEWSSKNLLALSACNVEKAEKLADYLDVQQVAGNLIYETGKTI